MKKGMSVNAKQNNVGLDKKNIVGDSGSGRVDECDFVHSCLRVFITVNVR